MPVRFPLLPWRLALAVALDLLRKRSRSFGQDARASLAIARIPLRVKGSENIPLGGPGLILLNHYSRPGFYAWWSALAISAVVPADIHWTMTSAWTSRGDLWSAFKGRLSELLLPRLAALYGFTAMPPMPPRKGEEAERAASVRKVLAVTQREPTRLIALAPEGHDTAGGLLTNPPAGSGRFISLLTRTGGLIYPIGIYEKEEAFILAFGKSFHLSLAPGLTSNQRDSQVSQQVMEAIAALLPSELRGPFQGGAKHL
jgi:1-acyl-sn-glycerol-3-phosphate acyltransferase